MLLINISSSNIFQYKGSQERYPSRQTGQDFLAARHGWVNNEKLQAMNSLLGYSRSVLQDHLSVHT